MSMYPRTVAIHRHSSIGSPAAMPDVVPTNPDALRESVRARYAAAASAFAQVQPRKPEDALTVLNVGACCGGADSNDCCSASSGVVSEALYAVDEISALPSNAVLASLGCGNPTALAELKAGEKVLDL